MKHFYLVLVALLITSFGFGQTTSDAWINELHYDNSGGDVNEGVEIVVADISTYPLSNWFVQPYNGSNGASYSPLGNFTSPNSQSTNNGFTIAFKAMSGLQNGAPDGLALYYDDGVSTVFVQFISYEGSSFTATNGVANGQISENIGVSETSSTPIGQSLQLSGTGSQYSDFIWQTPATATDGNINNSQTFTAGGSNSSDADIVESGFDEPDNIDYTLYSVASGLTTGTAIQIGEFIIRDSGATPGDTDVVSTILTDLTFSVTGFADIAAIALFDGPANVSEITAVTASTSFSSLSLTAADDGSYTFQVYATFKSTVTDNNQLQLTITSATADGVNGSTFSAADAGGAQTSVIVDDNRIEVTATDLIFNIDPTNVGINIIMSPSPTVLAVDSNLNTDLDITDNVSLTTTGTFDGTATTTVAAVAGEATFNNLLFSTTATGITLTATSGLLTDDTSVAFDVAVLPVVIAIQDFETVPQTPVLNFSNTNGAFSTGTGPFPNDNNFVSGTRGWEAQNVTSTLTFGPVDVSAYSDIELDFRLASFSGTSGNGSDGSDEVLVQISLDNGVTFSNEIAINGNANARWSFDTGTGTATVIYDGDNTEASFAPAAGGNRTTDGYSFISITDITNSSQLVVRMTMTNNSSSEYWIIDDVALSGILLPTYDNDTEVLDPISQVAAATVIAANVTTSGTAFDAFGFDVEDQGTADGLPTNITTMRFVPGPNNTADWTDHIQGITLLDGNVVSYTPTTSISDTEIVLTFGTAIAVADNTALEFLLGIYLNTTNIVDGSIIQLQVDAASSGFAADALTGSSFIDPFTLGAVVGNNITIDVDVTEIVFTQQPPAIVDLNVAMSDVIVQAQDVNGNIDTDYNLNVNITSTGTLSVSPVTATAVAGLATFSTITHTVVGTGLVLTADDSLFPPVNSTAFDVAILPTIIAQQDFDGSLPDWTYTNDVAFFDNGWGVDGYFGLIDISLASPINQANMSGNILGECDLDDEGNGTSGIGTTTLNPVDISLYENVTLTFDWQIVNYNANNDDARYQVYFDGIGQGIVFLIDGGVDPTDGSGTVTINIPNVVSSVSLEVQIRNNGADGFSGFDNFKVEGFLPSIVYEGNNSNGFGGPLGEGDLEITAFTGTTADFTFIRGTGAFGDHMVIYIDSEAGGVSTTSGLTDTGDAGRIAISGYSGGTNRSTLNFPPGFEADFAIAIDQGFAGLFQIVPGGSHVFVANAGLTPIGTTQTSYDFSINFADINTTAGAESFKFVATYLNSGNAFRSNEFIGDSDYNNNALGNPGYTAVDMNTYYQVSSRKKGGRASSSVAGNWSDDASWANGNAPLAGDVITINHDITQNVNYNSVNNIGTSSIEITGTNTLTVNSINTLQMADGITGSGSLAVNGQLTITEGGFTDVIPTYISGSTLEYKDITATYNRFNEWNVGATVGAGVPDNVIIDNTTLDISNPSGDTTDEDFSIGNNLTLLNSASLNIDATKNLVVGGNLSNTVSTVVMNSTSQRYSSLIIDGTSTGNVTYNRHVNGNTILGDTNAIGNNDLVSAPVSGQTFGAFASANANLLENPGDATEKAFAIFDKTTGNYENYFTTTNASTTLDAGVGYRAATNNTAPLAFTGTVNTGTVTNNIVNSGPTFAEWNLIGNPYPSYLKVQDFLNYEVATGVKNLDLFVPTTAAIYGFDGDATGVGGNGYTIYNLATTTASTVIAPGQGFLVSADAVDVAAYDVTFVPAMRATGTDDDFILGRNSDVIINLELQITSATDVYVTDIYFNENASLGLDPGYDAAIFGGSAPTFAIYSQLVEENTGLDMAIQTLGSTDLSNVTIPIGINVLQGQQVTISISETTIPTTILVYLEDNVENTFTLLNNSDYTFTADTELTETGRFFLRFSEEALSTSETELNRLEIYTSNSPKAIIINGQLTDNTITNLYDIQGRLVLTKTLNQNSSLNQINTSGINSGIYIVQLQNNNQNRTQKVIIE